MSTRSASLFQPTDPWVLARERYLKTLTDEQKQLFVCASLENVFYTSSVEQRSYQENSKAVAWITRLKPFTDAISNYGTALDVFSNTYSLVMCPLWGSIRVLLQIAREFESYLEKVVDMLARIGDVLPNFRVYEKIFAGHHAVFNALSDVYLEVIEFCLKVKDVFLKAKSKRLSKYRIGGLWRTFDKEFGEVVEKFRRHEKKVEAQALVAHMIEAENARQEMQLEKARQLVLQKEMKRQQLLKKLSNIDHRSRHRKLRKTRHKSTGTWILKAKQYLEWTSKTDSCCLWCYGIPGSGKTILMTSVVDKLVTDTSSPGAPIVVYFYCDYTNADSLDVSRIVENFILQLLSTKSEIPEELGSILLDAYIGIRKPDFDELLDILSSTIKLFDNIYIILDGIDECTDNNRTGLLKVVHSIMTPGPTAVKLLLSSRKDVDLEKAFNTYLCLQISGNDISADIETFVHSIVSEKIASGALTVRNPALVQDISRALTNGAQGMFIWVTFQVEDLCEETCDSGIRTVLQNLPTGLVETYNRALRKIHIKQPTTILFVQKIFKWVTCARRPLTIDEIKEAISISPGDRNLDSDKITTDDSKIIQACANLVVFDSDDRTIRFAHYSVKEFLLCAPNHDESNANVHFQLLDAEREVGEICVTYLSFQNFRMEVATTETHDPKTSNWDSSLLNSSFLFRDSYLGWFGNAIMSGLARFRGYKNTRSGLNIDWNEYLRKTPSEPPKPEFSQRYRLLDYVIENWADHTIGFSDTDILWSHFKSLALEKHLSFSFRPWGDLGSTKNFPYMLMVQWAIEKGHGPLLKLLVAPPRGPILSIYLDQKIAEGSKLSVTALNRSAKGGYYPFTKLLLDNAGFQHIDLKLALNLAVDGSHSPIITLLLDRMTQSYSTGQCIYDMRDALHLAVRQGKHTVAQLLLERGAIDLNNRDKDGYTALHLAAKRGHDQVVRCLLARGAGTDIRDNGRYTALHLAAKGGHVRVVRCLLDGGAGTDIIGALYGYTALHLAAEGGHDQVVRCLLDGGAGIDITGILYGYTALHLAAKGGHVRVVRCLLDGGAGTDITDGDVYTALHLAAKEGHDQVVRCLLARGAGTDIRDNGRYTALHLAAKGGHVRVVRCLLDGGAGKYITGALYGYTALHLAAEGGHDQVVRCLLGGGTITDIRDDGGHTALHLAAKEGRVQVVLCLLHGGASTDITDGDGYTALHLAAEGGHDQVVRYLLARGVGTDIRDNGRYTALHLAAKRGHDQVVQCLLDGGAGTDITDEAGYTALHLAAEGGHDQVVRCLLDGGAGTDITDEAGYTALHLAAKRGHDQVVQCLLDGGAGTDITDEAGYTALHLAAKRGHDQVVRCLLDGGAGVGIINLEKQTALDLAIIEKHMEIIRLLRNDKGLASNRSNFLKYIQASRAKNSKATAA